MAAQESYGVFQRRALTSYTEFKLNIRFMESAVTSLTTTAGGGRAAAENRFTFMSETLTL